MGLIITYNETTGKRREFTDVDDLLDYMNDCEIEGDKVSTYEPTKEGEQQLIMACGFTFKHKTKKEK